MTGEDADVSLPRWRDPVWRAAVDGWVEERLARLGLRPTADAEQDRSCPWSTVIEVPTNAGTGVVQGERARHAPGGGALRRARPTRARARAAPAGTRRRPRLAAAARRRADPAGVGGCQDRPGRVGADAREYAAPAARSRAATSTSWRRGPARSPSGSCPRCARPCSPTTGCCCSATTDGLTAASGTSWSPSSAAYAARCADLAAYGIALTLQHDDLHDNNVFAPPSRVAAARLRLGRRRGRAPFGVLLISLRVVSDLLSVPEAAPELLRLRDAYLEPWTGD